MSKSPSNAKTGTATRQLLTLLNTIEPNNGRIVEVAKNAIDFDGIRKEIDSWQHNYKFMSNAAKQLKIQISNLTKSRPSNLTDIYHYQSEFEEVKGFLFSLLRESRNSVSSIPKEKATKSQIQELSVLSNKEFEKLYRNISSGFSSVEGRIKSTISAKTNFI